MLVNAYSAWINGRGSVSVLCGVESDSLTAQSMGLTARLVRTCIHVFAPAIFEKSLGIPVTKLEGTDPKNPFNFEKNDIAPINMKSVFNRDVRIQIVETSDFDQAVKLGIINEKDANGTYIVRESAYKQDRETKSRVVDANGNFVYRKCFLRPDTEAYADVTTSVAQRRATDLADVASLTEAQVDETVSADDVPF